MFIHKNLGRSLRFVMMTIAAVILSAGAILAQNVKVSGTVVDVNNEPLIGVYVMVQGTTTGTSTDVDGKYTLDCPGNANLVFSLMGMKEVVVPVNNKSVINVTMEEDAVLLEDVVVTALGIKKERKSLGYAVSDIKSDELMKNKTANPISSLSGKIAGVNITQAGGGAGSGAQIILRGGTSAAEGKDNQPLIVVDGIVYDNSSSVVGNSAFDGSMKSATTSSNCTTT